MNPELIEIGLVGRGGASSVVVIAPHEGGSIRSFHSEFGGEQYRWLANADEARPACFPMVPFGSRIRDGCFTFDSNDVRLARNDPTGGHAIHGHGATASWRVLQQERARLVLEYAHPADAWPWQYVARQTFSLHERGLQIELAVRNLSPQVMPAGLGIHPYFPRTAATRLRAPVARWLRLDADLLPIGREPVPQLLDVSAGLGLEARAFDHVFCEWSGDARIDWPEQHTSLRLSRRRSGMPNHLVLWAPAGAEFFCLEPVSNLPDGFNLPDDLPNRFVHVPAAATYNERWLLSPLWR